LINGLECGPAMVRARRANGGDPPLFATGPKRRGSGRYTAGQPRPSTERLRRPGFDEMATFDGWLASPKVSKE
jgi:hypothetical protein